MIQLVSSFNYVLALLYVFQELISFRKVYTHDDYKSGMSNIAANYVQSVLPGKVYCIYYMHFE